MKISGADPDFHRRDLWEAIEAGAFPEYELGVQIFTEEQAERFSFDVLDATKIVPEELVPLTPVGRMVLDRNPDNFFAETEQVAFCTAHVVPGIDFTNDPLLAGRIHSYVDTQISRLGGPNFHEIPINAPVAQVHNNQRDGMHRQAINRGRVAYEPNSLGGGCPFQAGLRRLHLVPASRSRGDKVRGKPEKFADHYTQARALLAQPDAGRAGAHRARVSLRADQGADAGGADGRVTRQRRAGTGRASRAGPRYSGAGAAAQGARAPPQPEVERSPALSLMARPGDGDRRAANRDPRREWAGGFRRESRARR